MSVYFISDTHFGHKQILDFTEGYRQGSCVEEHNQWLLDCINSTVNKNDKLFILGDVVWTKDVSILGQIRCKNMALIMGNHDQSKVGKYTPYFGHIHGLWKYKDLWLSHAPIHPSELRGKKNGHGHVHQKSVQNGCNQLDKNYLNFCVEALGGIPVSYEEILNGSYDERRKC